MGVPFLTIVAFAINKEHSIKVDHEIRVCTTSKSVMGRPYLSIIKNYWILEKEIGRIGIDDLEIDDEIYDFDDVRSISRLSESPDGKMCLEFEFDDGKTLSNCIKQLPVY